MKKPKLRCLQLTNNKRIFFFLQKNLSNFHDSTSIFIENPLEKEINKNNETLKRDSTYT